MESDIVLVHAFVKNGGEHVKLCKKEKRRLICPKEILEHLFLLFRCDLWPFGHLYFL